MIEIHKNSDTNLSKQVIIVGNKTNFKLVKLAGICISGHTFSQWYQILRRD